MRNDQWAVEAGRQWTGKCQLVLRAHVDSLTNDLIEQKSTGNFALSSAVPWYYCISEMSAAVQVSSIRSMQQLVLVNGRV